MGVIEQVKLVATSDKAFELGLFECLPAKFFVHFQSRNCAKAGVSLNVLLHSCAKDDFRSFFSNQLIFSRFWA